MIYFLMSRIISTFIYHKNTVSVIKILTIINNLKISNMKTLRNFKFVLTCVPENMQIVDSELSGEIMFTSECHYYCEKEILSCIKDAAKRDSLGEYYVNRYCIYKVNKGENGAAQLVEVISVDESGISIR